MKKIVNINRSNLNILQDFLEHAGTALSSFRYFSKRPLDVISNHLTTCILLQDGIPVCYGHLDKEADKVWLGIAVKEGEQGRGYGNEMMQALTDFAVKNAIHEVHLSVDNTNEKAISLYLKYGFKLVKKNESISFYTLSL